MPVQKRDESFKTIIYIYLRDVIQHLGLHRDSAREIMSVVFPKVCKGTELPLTGCDSVCKDGAHRTGKYLPQYFIYHST
jgi:hypothetical protein